MSLETRAFNAPLRFFASASAFPTSLASDNAT